MVSTLAPSAAKPPLLETKLYVPAQRDDRIARPALIARLDVATQRRLTLIAAPAGFGKSTLLAEWLRAGWPARHGAAWLSLDRRDNDPALFWSYLIAAIDRVRPGSGARASDLLHADPPAAVESTLTALINAISAEDAPIALILDDLHLIDAPAIHEGLTFLLDHLPPQLRVVIATRADPPLPVARLRARGDAAELRVVDLRFSREEIDAFLNRAMRLSLDPAEIATLDARTEGWIAGLQLAALSMQGRADVAGFVAAFAGDDRFILDYLIDEVLERQPEHIRRFLLETAFLDRLCAPLCDAVTGRTDGGDVLQALERANLFLAPLDDKRQWHRYHHLFAEALRAQAERVPLRALAERRRRAAEWFDANGLAVDAIEHARAAGDHDTVARVLVAAGDELLRANQVESIAGWSSALPEAMLRVRPRLALLRATAVMRIDPSLARARELIAWAEEAIGQRDLADPDGTAIGPDGRDALRGELLALKIQTARDIPPDEIARMAGEALALAPPERHQTRGMLHLVRAGVLSELHDIERALPLLDEGAEEARRAKIPMLLTCILEHRGQLFADAGRLQEARRSYEDAIAVSREAWAVQDPALCSLSARLAEVLLEQGDDAGAATRMAEAIDLADRASKRSYVLVTRVLAMRQLLAAGDVDGARTQVARAREFAHGVRAFRFASFLAATEIEFYRRTGDLPAAASVARARALSPDSRPEPGVEEELLAYAALLLATGDHAGAAQALDHLAPELRRIGRAQRETPALVMLAVARDATGRRGPALDALGRATMLGERGGFHRTFTREWPDASRLLRALADAVRRGEGPVEHGAPAYLNRLMAGAETSPGSPETGLVEGLTQRETEVLQLIALAKRNQEIADELFISLATVKRHIANAYGKLGVRHRAEAIARARELNLL